MHSGSAAAGGMASLGLLVWLAMATTAGPLPDPVSADLPRGTSLGGFSAIEVMEGGASALILSDRGTLVAGRLERDTNGVLRRFELSESWSLFGLDGTPLSEGLTDSEGLALASDGTIYVSFEGPARILSYAAPGSSAVALPEADAFSRLQDNAALEALAIDASGQLHTMPERSGRATRPFPVWRWDGVAWTQAFEIARRGHFLPVGADFGPDGRFYLLERDFTGLAFRSRIRRFSATGGGEETLLTTTSGRHGNLEGISVWRAADGSLRATMVSDDNFKSFQRSEIVEYVLPE